MRLLADENIPKAAAAALRAMGFDVEEARVTHAGMPDEELLRTAASGRRVLLTFDKDFAALVYRDRMPAPNGVILLRMAAPSPEAVVEFFRRLFASPFSWEGRFSVVTETQVRQNPMPGLSETP